eukprot:SM000069S20697  [mRNA]  locus=s69:362952:368548:+ [translate_table: standard]
MGESSDDEGADRPPDKADDDDDNDKESDFVEVDPTGRYGRYDEVLGKGAFKTVYRAFDEVDGIEVAWNQVKVQDVLQSPEDLERLYSEVHLLKTLRHKNIIKFYNSWVDAKTKNVNFITEIFTSGTLRQYRKKHKHCDLKAVKNWARQILRGLLYLHSHDPPIIHRDLKCDNIFVNGNQGEVKIGDLGLAAILRQAHAAHSVIGTPEFMAPELYEEEYNELVDIYSFGMCVLEMVTFEYPYSECMNAAQIYKKVTAGKKPAALDKVKDAEVRAFVEKCLATASRRMPARELLMDPFLREGEKIEAVDPPHMLHSDSRPDNLDALGSIAEDVPHPSFLESRRDAGGQEHLARSASPQQQEADNDESATCSSDSGDHADDQSHLQNEDYNNKTVPRSRDFKVKGRRLDHDEVHLRLRIADSEGHVRSIQFPFDVKVDSAFSVASEMVEELDLSDQDVTTIADMIDAEIMTLIPEWKPGVALDEATSTACGRSEREEGEDEDEGDGLLVERDDGIKISNDFEALSNYSAGSMSPQAASPRPSPLLERGRQISRSPTNIAGMLANTSPPGREGVMHGRFAEVTYQEGEGELLSAFSSEGSEAASGQEVEHKALDRGAGNHHDSVEVYSANLHNFNALVEARRQAATEHYTHETWRDIRPLAAKEIEDSDSVMSPPDKGRPWCSLPSDRGDSPSLQEVMGGGAHSVDLTFEQPQEVASLAKPDQWDKAEERLADNDDDAIQRELQLEAQRQEAELQEMMQQMKLKHELALLEIRKRHKKKGPDESSDSSSAVNSPGKHKGVLTVLQRLDLESPQLLASDRPLNGMSAPLDRRQAMTPPPDLGAGADRGRARLLQMASELSVSDDERSARLGTAALPGAPVRMGRHQLMEEAARLPPGKATLDMQVDSQLHGYLASDEAGKPGTRQYSPMTGAVLDMAASQPPLVPVPRGRREVASVQPLPRDYDKMASSRVAPAGDTAAKPGSIPAWETFGDSGRGRAALGGQDAMEGRKAEAADLRRSHGGESSSQQPMQQADRASPSPQKAVGLGTGGIGGQAQPMRESRSGRSPSPLPASRGPAAGQLGGNAGAKEFVPDWRGSRGDSLHRREPSADGRREAEAGGTGRKESAGDREQRGAMLGTAPLVAAGLIVGSRNHLSAVDLYKSVLDRDRERDREKDRDRDRPAMKGERDDRDAGSRSPVDGEVVDTIEQLRKEMLQRSIAELEAKTLEGLHKNGYFSSVRQGGGQVATSGSSHSRQPSGGQASAGTNSQSRQPPSGHVGSASHTQPRPPASSVGK